jgi:hypothetical protein
MAVRVVDLVNCRSLGLDEARLAVNISARSFAGLLAPLDLDQSAPPLFLWGERLVVELLGHGDCVLRLLPFIAGIAAVILMYPFAARFLRPVEARLAAVIVALSPLLITYSNAVKQYSVELFVAIAFVLIWERALDEETVRKSRSGLLLAGAVAPWASLTSVFLLAACWLHVVVRWVRREDTARLALGATVLWALSVGTAYLTVYQAAGRSPYLRRFWELAFIVPTRPGFVGDLWKTLQDHVWGFVAGDPLIDRRAFTLILQLGTVVVLLLCSSGAVRILRAQGAERLWYLCGPCLATLGAAMIGAFPVAPRLTLFLLPPIIVLLVAGIGSAWSGLAARQSRVAFALTSVVLVLPMALYAIVRVFALEPSGHFQQLVRELGEHRLAGEPVYVFARTLPAWIYYSTDWSDPDSDRLSFLAGAASSRGPAFENAPSRGRVKTEEGRGLLDRSGTSPEILGLPSGMEWRAVEGHVRSQPDTGWVEVEFQRIQAAATPGVWVIATAFYEAESELFRALERAATRRTFAHLRDGSALVRYEFSEPSRPSQSPGTAVQGQKQATKAQ